MKKWNDKFRYQVASCWLFILRCNYPLFSNQIVCAFCAWNDFTLRQKKNQCRV